MINLTQCLTLLPLRLEIRKMTAGSHSIANFSSTNSLRLPSSPNYSPLSLSTEYWIRWYPDDLALYVPPKKITSDEQFAFKTLKKFCESQLLSGLEALAQRLMHDLRTTLEKAEGILEIYNGLRTGKLMPGQEKICQNYNEDALKIILKNYEGQKMRLPEERKVGLRLGRKVIYDSENPVIAWAWRIFTQKVGTARAYYIASLGIDSDQPDAVSDPLESTLKEGIDVAVMPPWIQLYTINDPAGPLTEVSALTDPIAIDWQHLKISSRETTEALWLIDFNAAIAKGMGTKISDPNKVKQIEQAQWLLATGYSGDEAPLLSEKFQRVLKALQSRSELYLSPQDSPTNNTEKCDSGSSEIRFAAPNSGFDGKLLSSAFQGSAILASIPGSMGTEQMEAESMALLIFRTCTEGAQNLFQLPTSAWQTLEKIFVKFVRARGPLPILTAGKNPYGILPILKLEDWKENKRWLTEDDALVVKWIAQISRFLKTDMEFLGNLAPSLSNVPEAEQYAALLEILRLHRVSKELYQRKISKNDSQYTYAEDAQYILGNLAQDLILADETPSPEIPGREYLEALAFGSYVLSPTARQRSVLLPKRIEYVSSSGRVSGLEHPKYIQSVELSKKVPLPKFALLHKVLSQYLYGALPDEEELRKRVQTLKGAAQNLLKLDVEKLEILMMEIFDLLTFRLDAWITALATIRMNESLSSSETPKGLILGAYGWLEKPGALTDSGIKEYIQAPSLAQATTAALLRSGSENLSSSFQIQLNSKRVREGASFLEKLRNGYLAGEILGYRLEKMIRRLAPTSPVKEADIYPLRELFPLPHRKNGEIEGQETAYSTLIDGKQFVESFDKITLHQFSQEKITELENLKDLLQNVTDAAADLSVSEVVYQFIQGNSARAGAWIDFMEGEVAPPELEFTECPRTGTLRDTRIYLSIPDQGERLNENAHPSHVFDPSLAEFCDHFLTNWPNETLTFSGNLSLTPSALDFSAFDLILWGEEGLIERARSIREQPTLELLREESTPLLKKAQILKRCLLRNRKDELPLSRNPFEDPIPKAFKGSTQILWGKMAERLKSRYDWIKNELIKLRMQMTKPKLGSLGFPLNSSMEDVDKRLLELSQKEEQLLSQTDETKVFHYAKLLCLAIGRPNAPLTIPYLTTLTQINFDYRTQVEPNSVPPDVGINLDSYAKVRPAVQDLLNLFTSYHQYFHGMSNLNEVYLAPSPSVSGTQGVILLELDAWNELLPNAVETTALAVRYPTPKSQAPNAILIATPPSFDATKSWTPTLVAETLADTLKLMKIRMIATDEIIGDNNLGKYFPFSLLNNDQGLILEYLRALYPYFTTDPYQFQILQENEELPPLPPTAKRS